MKSRTSWGIGKTWPKRNRRIPRTKIRWKLLGLQDPAQASPVLSMADIRRNVISAASHGLGEESLARSQMNDVSRASGVKTSRSTGKGRRGASL